LANSKRKRFDRHDHRVKRKGFSFVSCSGMSALNPDVSGLR
jgi:hypothetical protein